MMKALYSGVSGLRSHQTKMDVIGNNIANVNTYGFKSQRATFRDVYYQTIKSPSEGSAERGGTNSSQVGYGAQVGSIDTIHSLSGYSPTDSATDIYINGEGYFIVQNPSGDKLYTRLGALSFDSKGNLVDVNGSQVCGWNKGEFTVDSTTGKITVSGDIKTVTIANFSDYKNITINGDGTISATNKTTNAIETVGLIGVAFVPNQSALILEGSSYYSAGNNTGTISYEIPGTNGTGAIVTNGLEMSNVDLAKEFSDMIITQRGFQANTKIISVVDQMLDELVNLKR